MHCGVTFCKDLMAQASVEKEEQLCLCHLNNALSLGLFLLPQSGMDTFGAGMEDVE